MFPWSSKCFLLLICLLSTLCIMANVSLAVQPAHDLNTRQESKIYHPHHVLVKESCCTHGHCNCEIISVSTGGNAAELVPIKVVHIRYRAQDKLGYFLGIMSLMPVFIAFGSIPTVVFFWRDLQTTFFGLGLLLSEAINVIVKQIVKQPRPYTCKALDTCDTFGWPSGHAQFICFFSLYVTLLALYWLNFSEPFLRVLVIALLWLFAPTVMYSRVYLGYHTVGQVVAGAVVGSILGGLWYFVVNSIIARHFTTLEKSAFCRRFLISYKKCCKAVISTEHKNMVASKEGENKEGKQIGKARKLGKPLKKVKRIF